MSGRAQDLVERFEQANQELISVVEGLSDEQWTMQSKEEGRSVGVVAHHVAFDHPIIAGWVKSLAERQPVRVNWKEIHELNARHATENTNASKNETIDLLRKNGAEAVGIIRELGDEQLLGSAEMELMDGAEVTAGQLIETLLIGHIQMHLKDIQAALGQ